jgi:two-component system response regulator MprA
MEESMTRVLVVEDEEDIAHFIRRGLLYKGYEVDVALDGEEALAAARDRPPDLVVLDLMLPGLDGVEVCRRLRTDGDVPIIILTARDAVSDKVEGLDAGADDYLTKPFAFDELLARVRAALRRRHPPEEVITVGDLTIRPASREVFRGGREVGLTKREYELLELLARNAGHVVSKEVIFEKVWGFDYEGESDAIKVYIRYLRKKLDAAGGPDLIRAVRGVGYMLKA